MDACGSLSGTRKMLPGLCMPTGHHLPATPRLPVVTCGMRPSPSLNAVCLLLFALRSSTLAIGIFVAFTKVQREHWQLVARQCAADKSHEIITRVTVNAVKLSDPPLAPTPRLCQLPVARHVKCIHE